uniref:S100/CaBP-9k-type calcium binding subdomain domain-containing protein n=1 Tax=Ursus americanus TaxID=9643 RepID=A0A452RLZ5_URSAM
MLSEIEHAMETMTFMFRKSARDKVYLTKDDLRALMEKQFPGFLEIEKTLWLWKNNEGHGPVPRWQSRLPELLFTIACNEYSVVDMKQKRKK